MMAMPPAYSRGKPPRRHGLATIVVLITAAMLGLLAVTMIRVTRNDQLRTSAACGRRITRQAAAGAAHRGVVMLRRQPALRGRLAAGGPEAGVGIATAVDITQMPNGDLQVTATAVYGSSSWKETIVVDPTRLE